jgi:hypothetical protein
MFGDASLIISRPLNRHIGPCLPIYLCCKGLNQPYAVEVLSAREIGFEPSDPVGRRRIMQHVTNQQFLPGELLRDQLLGNLERRSIGKRERLRSAQLGIGGSDRASNG